MPFPGPKPIKTTQPSASSQPSCIISPAARYLEIDLNCQLPVSYPLVRAQRLSEVLARSPKTGIPVSPRSITSITSITTEHRLVSPPGPSCWIRQVPLLSPHLASAHSQTARVEISRGAICVALPFALTGSLDSSSCPLGLAVDTPIGNAIQNGPAPRNPPMAFCKGWAGIDGKWLRPAITNNKCLSPGLVGGRSTKASHGTTRKKVGR